MKEILKVAFVYAGCYLGAGYVSGQELYQFFGTFGKDAFYGIAVAVLLQFILGVAVLKISMKTGIYEADKIISGENKTAGKVFGFFESFFMFGIFVIMTAGAGTLIKDLSGLDIRMALLLFCVVCGIFALSGIKGMTKVFSAIVPVLVVFTLAVFFLCTNEKGIIIETAKSFSQNPLLHNWLLSAGVFVSYNFFCSVAILAPVGVKLKSEKNMVFGVLLGCLFLALISVSIVISMNCFPESADVQLPMVYISGIFGSFMKIVYPLLLLAAMFSTSLSCIVATVVYIDSKIKLKSRVAAVSVICTFGCILSGVGFSELISFVYPLCGYLGLFAAFGVIYNWLKGNGKNENIQ